MTTAPYELRTLVLTAKKQNIAEDLSKWAANFKKDPSHAMEWADRTFELVAQQEVNDKILLFLIDQRNTLEKTETHEELTSAIQAFFNKQMMQAASNACRVGGSSSTSSNALDRAKAEAWLSALTN